MYKLNAVLAVSVACAVLSACTQSPTALTPDAAPRLDGGHTFGPGHNTAPAGGITSADGGHGFGSGHLTGGTTTTAVGDTTSRGHGFGPGH
jgi:hypothetical protein